MLGPLLLLWALGSPDATTTSSFTFHDAAAHDGRSVLTFRLVEFAATPVRPLTFDSQPGEGARYGLLPLGGHRDSSLAIVWDAKALGGPRLWLDANNDTQLTATECHLLKGKELELTVAFNAPTAKGSTRLTRTVIFRPSALTGGLTYAVRGYATGVLKLGPDSYKAMLTDGDADGCFHGAGTDRLWIDLDGDGRFDPIAEQFPLGSPITVQGQVYTVKSDATASQVQVFRRTTARGSARFSLLGKRDGLASNVEAQLISDIGEMVTIHDIGRSISLPAGKYRIASVRFQMMDAKGREWTYRFAGEGTYVLNVKAGQESSLTLLSGLSLNMKVTPPGPAAPEQRLHVTPSVSNPLGLFLTDCSFQVVTRTQPCVAEIRLVSPERKVVDRAASGFN